jgi:DNA-binding NtrC family response regulator
MEIYAHATVGVLMVHDDLGFMFWLAEALSAAGIAAVPASEPSQAAKLISASGIDIRVLIVNPWMPGAFALIERVRGWVPSLKVIATGDFETRVPGIDYFVRMPFPAEEPADLSRIVKTVCCLTSSP